MDINTWDPDDDDDYDDSDEAHDQAIADYNNQDWSEPEDYSGLGSPMGEPGYD